MAKSDLTGTNKLKGNKVSHSNIKTKRWQNPNLQERRIFVPELKRHVNLRVTTRELRTLDKLGFVAYAKKLGLNPANY
ncbi:MAG: 50S ribosomal protein L28 [Deltaproteobacteria bacterium]|nr:50S ribosomal protein L28 [Deltaproteobacteria bacterium]